MPDQAPRRHGFKDLAEETAHALDAYTRGELVRATWMGGRQVTLSLRLPYMRADEEPITLLVAVLDQWGGPRPRPKDDEAERDVGVGRGRGRRIVSASDAREYATKQNWTERELREQGLPLYWSRDWMLAQVEAGKSLAEIAREHRYKYSTLENWAVRYELRLKPRQEEKRLDLLADWATGAYGQQALATKHGVSLGTVDRWIRIAELGEAGYRADVRRRREEREKAEAKVLVRFDQGETKVLRLAAHSGLTQRTVRALLERERGRKPRATRKKTRAARPKKEAT